MSIRLKSMLKQIPLLRLWKGVIEARVVQFLNSLKWKKLAQASQIKLELGAGQKSGTNGWTTVDILGADISHDLRTGIPLSNGSVDAIYTSHLLEHLPYSDLLSFITECRRVLKPGGQFSVCVPNFRNYIDAYVNKTEFRAREELYQPAVTDTGSLMDQLNYVAYMDGHHHYMFDEENLVKTLTRAGFTDVRLRSFDPELDMEQRDLESIYALAVK